ncbi:MAG: hypothetical protein ABI602_04015 [Candidatus Saccharibacteria bacterium]
MGYYFVNLIQLMAALPKTANGKCVEPLFFGLVPWYHYLNVDNKCNIVTFNALGSSSSDIPLIVLAVIDDLLRIVAILAIGFVIYGGIQYVVSQGQPDKTAKAQSTILNAIIGLAIALVAVGAVSYFGGKLGAN